MNIFKIKLDNCMKFIIAANKFHYTECLHMLSDCPHNWKPFQCGPHCPSNWYSTTI